MRQRKQQNLENARTPPRKRRSRKDLCFISKGLRQLSVSRAVGLFTVREHCSHSAVPPRLPFASGQKALILFAKVEPFWISWYPQLLLHFLQMDSFYKKQSETFWAKRIPERGLMILFGLCSELLGSVHTAEAFQQRTWLPEILYVY